VIAVARASDESIAKSSKVAAVRDSAFPSRSGQPAHGTNSRTAYRRPGRAPTSTTRLTRDTAFTPSMGERLRSQDGRFKNKRYTNTLLVPRRAGDRNTDARVIDLGGILVATLNQPRGARRWRVADAAASHR
jgi:hypothetical protein